MTEKLSNWAANFSYSAATVHRPNSVAEVQEIVRKARKVKALGTRHSFNRIADCEHDLVSTENLNRVLSVDHHRHQVTVEGGINYGQLSKHLYVEGFAIHNLASLPHISVAGACATGTHGSGDRNGNLSTAVSELEIVTADGTMLRLARGDSHFNGSVVNLGALGVVVGVTLDIVPSFNVRQDVYEGLPFTEAVAHFDEITSSGYSVSLFTDWKSDTINQVWRKRVGVSGNAESEIFGARLASAKLHPIGEIDPINCTDQMGVDGPWYDRLPHFRLDYTPSSGEELQSEYLVPRQNAVAALQAINAMRDEIAPHLLITEIRTMAGDSLWMSPSYNQPCVGIHFTLKKDWESVQVLLPKIEAALAPFDARPHWGKLFTMLGSKVQSLYSRVDDFKRLAAVYDPEGKFRNEFLDRNVFG